MIGSPDELTAYIEKVKEGVIGEDSSVNSSLLELQATIKNLSSITGQLDEILRTSSRSINRTFSNVEGLTNEVNDNKSSLSQSLKNLESFTAQLDSARVGDLIDASNQTMASADRVFTGLEQTLEETNKSVQSLKSILSDIDSGDGTLGQLVSNKSLYERLDRVTENLDLLLQDVRLNPKRYINVSVFGKKQKDHEKPEDDPAFKEE